MDERADVTKSRISIKPEAFKQNTDPVVAQFISGDTKGPLLESLSQENP